MIISINSLKYPFIDITMSVKFPITPGEMQSQLAASFKNARLEKGHSRKKAETLTGVPAPTIRKFETNGQISFRQFIMLCHVYGNLAGLEDVFPKEDPASLDALMSVENSPRQRGRS